MIRSRHPLPTYWSVALSMVAGIGASMVAVDGLALVGSGPRGFLSLGALIVAAGVVGHALESWPSLGARPLLPDPRLALAIGGLLLGLLVLVAVAPSSKIDELFYHMLIGRRVIEDHGLRVYMLPFEAAIVPQTGYQIAESVFYAAGAPDAGNFLAVACAAALAVLLAGVIGDETGQADLGALAAGTALVGLYPAVWYVTAGPHAFGDLAMFAAIATLWFPGRLRESPGRFVACILCAACAASTKLSLVPVSLAVTAIALTRARNGVRLVGVAAIIWMLLLGPLVIWTYVHTGSPFGLAFADRFGHTVYPPEFLGAIAYSRLFGQVGLWPALRQTARLLTGTTIVLSIIGLIGCAVWRRRFGLLGALVVFQVCLIALALPHEVRFLGGLTFGLVAVGAITIALTRDVPLPRPWVAGAALLLFGPWFVAELMYARPFASVALGASSRQAFVARYVPLSDDWHALDAILPRDAVLYAPLRVPAADAPRPVIFTLWDWDRSHPLYAVSAGTSAPDSGAVLRDAGLRLACDMPVYHNPDAVVASYRTPGTRNVRAAVAVRLCHGP
jgi:hypothetical protein